MNNSKIKTPMPEQEPNVRNKNFKEVTLGYTEQMQSRSGTLSALQEPSCGKGARLMCRFRILSWQ
jgi:hypothetical protein